MARIRTIKPEFFRHEGLFELERETGLPVRVAFAGLWTAADREGRFKWRPKQLKLDCVPYDEIDFSRVLDALTTRGFIARYEVGGEDFGCIPSWNEHQVINNRESPSDLPSIENGTLKSNTSTRAPRVNDACSTPLVQVQGEGKGREGKGREDKSSCAEPSDEGTALVVQPEPVAISLPLNTGSDFPVTERLVEEFRSAYPAIDVMGQLRAMRAWAMSNPTKRKTKTGILRFVNSWLSKAQDNPKAAIHENQPSRRLSAVEQVERAIAAERRFEPIDGTFQIRAQ